MSNNKLLRYVAVVITFMIFIALSFWTFESMVDMGLLNWYEVMLPLGVLWLVFIGITYVFVK